MEIPIFDSLTHPTINTNWLNPKYSGETIEHLSDEMENHNFLGGFAVDMGKNVGTHSHEEYFNFIKNRSDNLIPVAYLDLADFNVKDNLRKVLSKIKEIGYRCIKIHPRLGNIGYNHKSLHDATKIASDLNLIILFCTFAFGGNRNVLSRTIYDLNNFLNLHSAAKIILLHGGTTQVLGLSEVVRSLPLSQQVLLDLSWTICKYQGSSLDFDIQYLFKNFDRRICVGTDHPEFKPNDLRRRFEFFSSECSDEKCKNIAYSNIYQMLSYK